jgi:putative transcriptional regulator
MKATTTKKIAGDPNDYDWTRFDAITDREADEQAQGDPDNFVESETTIQTPRLRIIGRALDLTQEEFSVRFQIPLGTLRDWEQHRSEPDQAARAYLKVIAKDPDFVAAALADGRPAAAAE